MVTPTAVEGAITGGIAAAIGLFLPQSLTTIGVTSKLVNAAITYGTGVVAGDAIDEGVHVASHTIETGTLDGLEINKQRV